jgi:hypothetical protein
MHRWPVSTRPPLATPSSLLRTFRLAPPLPPCIASVALELVGVARVSMDAPDLKVGMSGDMVTVNFSHSRPPSTPTLRCWSLSRMPRFSHTAVKKPTTSMQ